MSQLFALDSPKNNWFNIFEKSEVEAKVEAEVVDCWLNVVVGPSIMLTERWSYGYSSMHLRGGWLLLNWVFDQHRTTLCIIRPVSTVAKEFEAFDDTILMFCFYHNDKHNEMICKKTLLREIFKKCLRDICL